MLRSPRRRVPLLADRQPGRSGVGGLDAPAARACPLWEQSRADRGTDAPQPESGGGQAAHRNPVVAAPRHRTLCPCEQPNYNARSLAGPRLDDTTTGLDDDQDSGINGVGLPLVWIRRSLRLVRLWWDERTRRRPAPVGKRVFQFWRGTAPSPAAMRNISKPSIMPVRKRTATDTAGDIAVCRRVNRITIGWSPWCFWLTTCRWKALR